jgi:hypothetical protein
MVAPGKNINYTITRPYPAGQWSVLAVGSMINTTGEDRVEKYFSTLTEQKLFNKQALQQSNQVNMILAGLAGVSAVIALGAAIVNHRHNNRVLEHTKEYTKAQLELMQESNELTKSQLKLREEERKASLGEADLEIVQYNAEPRQTGFQTGKKNAPIELYPNFKNIGTVDARNIKIYFKVFDKLVTLSEILTFENEIKKSVIEVDGSLAPGRSINLHLIKNKKQIIEWDRRDESKIYSVVIWYTFDYREIERGETIFNIQYAGAEADNRPTRYTKADIEQARGKRDGTANTA